jgi:hypothetical protein
VTTHGNHGPVGDQWWDTVYIAVKTQTGTLLPEDFFVLSLGHRPAVIRLLTAFFTIFTHFDTGILRFAAFTNTLLNLALMLLLLSRRQELIPGAFFFCAILLFTLYNTASWIDMYFSMWQQALFFVLTGLCILQRMHPGWPAFTLLILCAIAASLTVGSGLAAWVSLPVAALGIPEYRRPNYVIFWLVALTLFLVFYTSDYAVSPFKTEGDSPSLSLVFRDGVLSPVLYLFRFQSARFNISDHMALWISVISSLMLGVNFWQIIRSNDGFAAATFWGSLVVFSMGTAAIVVIGRGVDSLATRYSPGADGFWLASIALALLVLAGKPSARIAFLNKCLLVAIAILSALQNIRVLLSNDPIMRSCDQSIVEYPLYRDSRLQKCFYWSETQSAYHLAALRLSVFHDETRQLILPRTDAPVITDMPNRWLSVYVRDYMMAGLEWEKIYSIAPRPGAGLLPAKGPWPSPFYRGEWSTDILPQPLKQTWTSAAALLSDLPILTSKQPALWYLNTPETEGNFSTVQRAFSELGYTGLKFSIAGSYSSARFDLWCFERTGSDACAPDLPQPQR